MRWSPTWATTLGDHRYDDRLAPRDAAVDRAARTPSATRCSPGCDAIDADRARRDRRGDATSCCAAGSRRTTRIDVCKFHEWLVDAGGGSVLGERQLPRRVAHGEDAARRGQPRRAAEPGRERVVDDTIANLSHRARRAGACRRPRRCAARSSSSTPSSPSRSTSWAMASPRWATRRIDRGPRRARRRTRSCASRQREA